MIIATCYNGHDCSGVRCVCVHYCVFLVLQSHKSGTEKKKCVDIHVDDVTVEAAGTEIIYQIS